MTCYADHGGLPHMKSKAAEKTRTRTQLLVVLDLMQTAVDTGENIDSGALSSALEAMGEDFTFIESLIEDADVLNPDRTDDSDPVIRSEKLAALKERLPVWIELFRSSTSAKEVQRKAQEEQAKAEALFRVNMEKILNVSRPLEVTANAVDSFFQNVSKTKAARSNVYFLKAGLEDIRNTKEGDAIRLVREELHKRYFMDDKSESHAMVVLPGYFGKLSDNMRASESDLPISVVLKEYAEMAYEHNAMFITDYQDADSVKKIMDDFPKVKLAGPDPWRSSALLYGNWLSVRRPYKEYGEKQPLRMGPCMAVAGKMYCNDVSQPVAGATSVGQLSNVAGVRLHITNDIGTDLGRLGVNVVRFDGGKFYPGSFLTLHTGETALAEDKAYSVVMTHHMLHKGIQTIADTEGGKEKLGPTQKDKLIEKITVFLNKQKNRERIKDFNNVSLIPDPLDPTKVQIHVELTNIIPVDTWTTEIKSLPFNVRTNIQS